MASLDEPVSNEKDPFSQEHVGAFNLIALMRIYDVLMAIYREDAPDKAERLEAFHKEGKVLGSFPWLELSAEQVTDK